MLLGSTPLTSRISDAFAGGFVAGVVEGKSLNESIDMGHWLASLSIKELGPQYVRSFSQTHSILLSIITTASSSINASSTIVSILPSMAI